MSGMKYRAVFFDAADPEPERPCQIFGQAWPQMEDWANVKLAGAVEGSYVRFYENREIEIDLWHKPKVAGSLERSAT